MIWTFEHISMFQTRKSMIKPSQIHLQLRRKQTSLEDGMQYSHTKPTCTNSGSQALVLPPPGVHCRITKFTSPQNTNQLDHLQSSNVQNTELLEMVCESKKKKKSAISTLKDSLRCHISSASVSARFLSLCCVPWGFAQQICHHTGASAVSLPWGVRPEKPVVLG